MSIHQEIKSLELEEIQITGEVKCTSETWLPYHLQTSSPVEYHQGRETQQYHHYACQQYDRQRIPQ